MFYSNFKMVESFENLDDILPHWATKDLEKVNRYEKLEE